MKRKKILQILGYILVAVLFIILLINTDFKELVTNIKQVSIWIVLILILLQIITQLLLGIQWNRISKSILSEGNFYKMFYILSTGNVVEAITPGAKIGGEVTRLFYLKSELNASTLDATNIIVIQKSISMSVLFSICLISFIYLSTKISLGLSLFAQIIIYISCALLIILLISFLFGSSKLSSLLSKSNKKGIVKINKFVLSYSNATKMISRKEWVIQFVISMLVWILFPIKMAILCYSLNIDMNFFVIITVTMTSYMVGMLPITPGGIGTFEGTVISILALLNIGVSISTTIAIVFRIITFWFVMLMSTIFVSIYRSRCKNEKND